jgi:riboflavin biosynthesis pyrimidine reductase
MSTKSSNFLKGVNIKTAKSELGFISIKEVLKIVSKMGVNRLLVEGGARVWTSFLKTGFFDEIVMFTGNKIINDSALSCFNDFLPHDTQLGDFPNLTLTSLQNWKDDIEARWEVSS